MTDAQLGRFVRRTWHHGDFDRADLVRRRSATVSVVIPALDEQATVGAVVATAAGLEGLVDEVVVVDGGSSDATVAEAAAAGARVVVQSSPGGKGAALRDGLDATDGEIVVFLDADLHDADPRYVVGLLGPLLTGSAVGYVKACYDRPLDLGGELRPTGGGRVTELTARPLLNAFWPELAFVAQPLAGEYAGRRGVLGSVGFEDGWGVELGLLLDIAAAFGADAVGQVDLGSRRHSHQPLAALSRMAFEIVRVAADRLVAEGRLAGEVGDVLLQPVRDPRGRLGLDAAPTRPPTGRAARARGGRRASPPR